MKPDKFRLEDKEMEYVLNAELPGFEPEDIDVKESGSRNQQRARPPPTLVFKLLE